MLKFRFYETADNSGAHYAIYKIGIRRGDSLGGKGHYPGATFVVNIGRFLSLRATGVDKIILAGIKKQRIFPAFVTHLIGWTPRCDGSGIGCNFNKIILLDPGVDDRFLVGTGVYGPYLKESLIWFSRRQCWFLNEQLLYFL